MQSYELTDMIIDDDFYGEETVTATITHEDKNYSVTFKKNDLEIINSWVFEEETSLPANLTDELIEAVRNEVRGRI
ncbi:hypothetical protein [Bacillus suaedae]|uniref:Uncharacterized protein n=1 Tax=Halalkalibacter suaedae TaxID=2822140 RepID=A0A941ANV5_9BACI|nr:hypothetical protein [Bacillus suaedae]MBP3950772.1 hypothetical protein [Bacillus suaedae]